MGLGEEEMNFSIFILSYLLFPFLYKLSVLVYLSLRVIVSFPEILTEFLTNHTFGTFG